MAITTQPITAQPMKALARFMTTANSGLYVLAKGVLRHLQGVKFGNLFDVLLTLNLIFCNNAVFSWKASLSSVLAMSSAEAELIALLQDREISKDAQSISSFAGGFFITTLEDTKLSTNKQHTLSQSGHQTSRQSNASNSLIWFMFFFSLLGARGVRQIGR